MLPPPPPGTLTSLFGASTSSKARPATRLVYKSSLLGSTLNPLSSTYDYVIDYIISAGVGALASVSRASTSSKARPPTRLVFDRLDECQRGRR